MVFLYYKPSLVPGLKNQQIKGLSMRALCKIFFIIGILYFAWHFIFAAYHWIAAEGDSKKITDAKNEITYAIIGLAVIFSVFAVLKVIGLALGITGLETLSLPIPTI